MGLRTTFAGAVLSGLLAGGCGNAGYNPLPVGAASGTTGARESTASGVAGTVSNGVSGTGSGAAASGSFGTNTGAGSGTGVTGTGTGTGGAGSGGTIGSTGGGDGISCGTFLTGQYCSCSAGDGDANSDACGLAQLAGPGGCCADPGWPAAGTSCNCNELGCTGSGDGCSCTLNGPGATTSCSASFCCAVVGSEAADCGCFDTGECQPGWTQASSCTAATTPCFDPTQVRVPTCR